MLLSLSEVTIYLLRDFREKYSKFKSNNWAVEIEQYQIKLEYMKGINNTLADTMNTLIAILTFNIYLFIKYLLKLITSYLKHCT